MYKTGVLLLLSAVLTECAHIRFDYVPGSISLPKADDAKLALLDTPTVIGNLLGLTADKPNSKWQAHGDLLDRPSAGVVFLSTQDALAGERLYKLVDKAAVAAEGVTIGDLVDMQAANSDAAIVHIGETEMTSKHADGFDVYAKVDSLKTTGSKKIDIFLENAQRLINWLKQAKLHFKAADLYTVVLPETSDKKERDAVAAAVERLIAGVRAAYADNVLVATIADERAPSLMKSSERATRELNLSSRRKRAAEPTDAQDDSMPVSTATFYSANYPAMFSILLFTALTLAITVLFISYCMWTIEPDQDAIIYRLTMPRQAKKDL